MLDKNLMFCEALAVTVTAYATDTLALATTGSIKRERNGTPMEIIVQVVDEAFTAGGAATLVVGLTSGNTAALGGAQSHFTTTTIPVAQLTVGKKIRLPVDFSVLDADATHIGVAFTVATGPMLTGKVTSWLQPAGTDEQVI